LDRPVIREDTGIFVTKIRPKGVAAKHGGLEPGDRILEVGTHSTQDDIIAQFSRKLMFLVVLG
jgi:C-terminal processing protease CtpA/Prc